MKTGDVQPSNSNPKGQPQKGRRRWLGYSLAGLMGPSWEAPRCPTRISGMDGAVTVLGVTAGSRALEPTR